MVYFSFLSAWSNRIEKLKAIRPISFAPPTPSICVLSDIHTWSHKDPGLFDVSSSILHILHTIYIYILWQSNKDLYENECTWKNIVGAIFILIKSSKAISILIKQMFFFKFQQRQNFFPSIHFVWESERERVRIHSVGKRISSREKKNRENMLCLCLY